MIAFDSPLFDYAPFQLTFQAENGNTGRAISGSAISFLSAVVFGLGAGR